MGSLTGLRIFEAESVTNGQTTRIGQGLYYCNLVKSDDFICVPEIATGCGLSLELWCSGLFIGDLSYFSNLCSSPHFCLSFRNRMIVNVNAIGQWEQKFYRGQDRTRTS